MLGVMCRSAGDQGWMQKIFAALEQGIGEAERLEIPHEGERIAIAHGQAIGVGDGKREARSLQKRAPVADVDKGRNARTRAAAYLAFSRNQAGAQLG